jgi:hypothetical protein
MIGDIKYTWIRVRTAAKRTMTAEGVNAQSKDNARIIGSDFSLASYPISLFIVRNVINANINFTAGII